MNPTELAPYFLKSSSCLDNLDSLANTFNTHSFALPLDNDKIFSLQQTNT